VDRAIFYVCISQGQWEVRHQSRHVARFDSKDEARRAAIDLAHQAAQGGEKADVLVQSESQGFHLQWSSESDPYPPQFD
jgi:hypothetical protein